MARRRPRAPPPAWSLLLVAALARAASGIVYAGRHVVVDAGDAVCDVFSYGAVGDGVADDTAALQRAITALEAAGILPVFAVGNNGPACGSARTPGTEDDRLLSVGAVDRAGMVASFSGRGPAPGGGADPDVVAPGDGLISSIPPRAYASSAGTSMAAPQVAGVAALVMQANPSLVGRPEDVVRIIRRTARPAGDDACGTTAGGRRNNAGGFGIVDARAAVQAARSAAEEITE